MSRCPAGPLYSCDVLCVLFLNRAHMLRQLDSRALATQEDAEDMRHREDEARDQYVRRIEALKEECTNQKRRLEDMEEAKRRSNQSDETLRHTANEAFEAAISDLKCSLAAKVLPCFGASLLPFASFSL